MFSIRFFIGVRFVGSETIDCVDQLERRLKVAETWLSFDAERHCCVRIDDVDYTIVVARKLLIILRSR